MLSFMLPPLKLRRDRKIKDRLKDIILHNYFCGSQQDMYILNHLNTTILSRLNRQ